MRVLLDEHLPKRLARHLVRGSRAVAHVLACGLRGTADSKLLIWARTQNRVLLTRDGDFLNDIRFPPEEFAGIIGIQVSDASPRGTITAIEIVLAEVGNQDLSGRLVIVDDAGLRMRPGS